MNIAKYTLGIALGLTTLASSCKKEMPLKDSRSMDGAVMVPLSTMSAQGNQESINADADDNEDYVYCVQVLAKPSPLNQKDATGDYYGVLNDGTTAFYKAPKIRTDYYTGSKNFALIANLPKGTNYTYDNKGSIKVAYGTQYQNPPFPMSNVYDGMEVNHTVVGNEDKFVFQQNGADVSKLLLERAVARVDVIVKAPDGDDGATAPPAGGRPADYTGKQMWYEKYPDAQLIHVDKVEILNMAKDIYLFPQTTPTSEYYSGTYEKVSNSPYPTYNQEKPWKQEFKKFYIPENNPSSADKATKIRVYMSKSYDAQSNLPQKKYTCDIAIKEGDDAQPVIRRNHHYTITLTVEGWETIKVGYLVEDWVAKSVDLPSYQ